MTDDWLCWNDVDITLDKDVFNSAFHRRLFIGVAFLCELGEIHACVWDVI